MVAATDDGWDAAPPPMTAVAVRIEAAAVDAVRELAAEEGLTTAALMRRWVLERLAAEQHPREEPPPVPPKKKAVRKKRAS